MYLVFVIGAVAYLLLAGLWDVIRSFYLEVRWRIIVKRGKIKDRIHEERCKPPS